MNISPNCKIGCGCRRLNRADSLFFRHLYRYLSIRKTIQIRRTGLRALISWRSDMLRRLMDSWRSSKSKSGSWNPRDFPGYDTVDQQKRFIALITHREKPDEIY